MTNKQKIQQLQEDIDNIQKRMYAMDRELWALKNPCLYKIGDAVKVKDTDNNCMVIDCSADHMSFDPFFSEQMWKVKVSDAITGRVYSVWEKDVHKINV